MSKIRASVIFSTYNQVDWLEKVMIGYEQQDCPDFEIVIADDGSKSETSDLIKRFQESGKLNIVHVWHEDRGFQKSAILNKAIVAAQADYLIFSDGDCIPRRDFVSVHLAKRKPGHFISGGYFMLPMETSKIISREDIVNGNAFNKHWLYAHGLKKTYKTLKLTSSGFQSAFLNWVTPTKATWNGHNSSGWKSDLVAANGFDERMQYGGQDRELGERLVNAGIKPIQLRYSAVCLHLDHARGYKNEASIQKNRAIRKHTRGSGKTRTEYGITS